MKRFCISLSFPGFFVARLFASLKSASTLSSSIHHFWKRQTDCFQYSRSNIYDMTKLRPDLTLSFDSFGPMHYHSVASAAPVRSNLLGPLERSIQSMRPANGIMRESIWTSPVIYMVHHLGSSANNAI